MEKQEYEINIKKKKSVKRNDPNNKDFKTMKFYLAKLRIDALAEPLLEKTVSEKEKKLRSYKCLNLKDAKKLWDHSKDSKFQEFKEYRNMMDWASRKIKELMPTTSLVE